MDDWEKFDETSLPEKKDFYSHLNMKDITDAENAHPKRVCKDFETKNLEEYHDLYVQSKTLLLDDVLENFWNICLKIYEIDSAKFPPSPRLAWKADLKKTNVKIDFLTNIDILLMIEKYIRRGICHSIYRHANGNNKYMKDYDKNKESSYLKYWDLNNLYGWVMPQILPVNNFDWIQDNYQLNKDFIKNYNEESSEGYFLEVDV